MKRKLIDSVKFEVIVCSRRGTSEILTESVIDLRTEVAWNRQQIAERGIERFGDLNDMTETLNWNLNGDSSKFKFVWGQSGRSGSTGYAYVYD